MKRRTTQPAQPHSTRGFIVVELAISLTLLALLTGMLGMAVSRYRVARDHYAWRQAAAWAAEAQLARYQAGAPLDSHPPDGLLPHDIRLETQTRPGTGPWEGCLRVRVTAHVELWDAKPIAETVSASSRERRCHEASPTSQSPPTSGLGVIYMLACLPLFALVGLMTARLTADSLRASRIATASACNLNTTSRLVAHLQRDARAAQSAVVDPTDTSRLVLTSAETEIVYSIKDSIVTRTLHGTDGSRSATIFDMYRVGAAFQVETVAPCAQVVWMQFKILRKNPKNRKQYGSPAAAARVGGGGES